MSADVSPPPEYLDQHQQLQQHDTMEHHDREGVVVTHRVMTLSQQSTSENLLFVSKISPELLIKRSYLQCLNRAVSRDLLREDNFIFMIVLWELLQGDNYY